MARKKKITAKRPIVPNEHKDKRRADNPPVGLVTPDTDSDAGAKKKPLTTQSKPFYNVPFPTV